MKARDAKPGDRIRVGANVAGAALVAIVVEGTPSEPHLIRTNYGDFAQDLCDPTDAPATPRSGAKTVDEIRELATQYIDEQLRTANAAVSPEKREELIERAMKAPLAAHGHPALAARKKIKCPVCGGDATEYGSCEVGDGGYDNEPDASAYSAISFGCTEPACSASFAVAEANVPREARVYAWESKT